MLQGNWDLTKEFAAVAVGNVYAAVAAVAAAGIAAAVAAAGIAAAAAAVAEPEYRERVGSSHFAVRTQ